MIILRIAYISDLHLDFYVQPRADWERKLTRFLELLLPIEQADVLIVAGDLSHYNKQSLFALQFFSKYFERIFVVLGNHDYYLVSNNHVNRYEKQSMNREIELQQIIQSLPNVILLQHYEVTKFNHVSFAGSTNWYRLKTKEEQAFFDERSNDSKLIRRYSIAQQHITEMTAYERLDKVDVLVTHVPPIYIHSHLLDRSPACYLNQLKTVKAKHHIFGHCHEQETYEQNDAMYYINALGYPDEKLPQKIRTFMV